MKKNIFIVIAFFSLITSGMSAQEDSNIYDSKEKVYLHISSTDFLTGETLYYSFFTLNKSEDGFSGVSKIGHVLLIDHKGEVIIRRKVNLNSGKGEGDIFIPTTLKTGKYKIIGFTRWMMNGSPENFFQDKITIINPFEVPTPGVVVQNDSLSPINNKNLESLDVANQDIVEIIFNESQVSKRQKVDFKIISDQRGKFSLSIRKLNKLKLEKPISSIDFLNLKNQDLDSGNQHWLPELRGEFVTGTIKALREIGDVANKEVALSIPGESFMLRIVKTDLNGRFVFILDELPLKGDVVIQVMDRNKEDYEVVLDSMKSSFPSLKFENLLLVNDSFIKEVEERSIALQIENAYFLNKKDSILPEPHKETFYSPLEKEYVLDDYRRFESLAETIIEITNEMYFTKNNGIYEIHLRDYEIEQNRSMYGKTLVMVDGLLLQDVNELFAYPAKNIDKIEIVNHGYIYGPKIFNGVVNFITKDQNFISEAKGNYLLRTEILRPYPEKEYFKIDYSDAKNLERIPDFRNQLLWLPEIKLESGTKSVSFYTSDVEGDFEISLEGFTEDGQPVSIKKIFTVQ